MPGDDYDLAIVTDTGAWSQLEPLGPWLQRHHDHVIGLDHHAHGDDVATMRLVDPSAASTTQLLVPLLDELGCELTGGIGGVAELEFFTWPRRHIESYLLVRSAISRCLGVSREDWLVSRLLDEHIPAPHNEAALGEVDAKRLLASNGPIAQGTGQELRPSQIAKKMREGELHDDVLQLLGLLRRGLGQSEPERYLVAK